MHISPSIEKSAIGSPMPAASRAQCPNFCVLRVLPALILSQEAGARCSFGDTGAGGACRSPEEVGMIT